MNMNDRVFQKIDGTKIPDVIEYIKNHMQKFPTRTFNIYVGCDSQQLKKYTSYATAIVIHRVGKGAHVIYCRNRVKRINDFFTRMWGEVENGIQVSCMLKDSLAVNITNAIEVHFDFNVLPPVSYTHLTLPTK